MTGYILQVNTKAGFLVYVVSVALNLQHFSNLQPSADHITVLLMV